MSNKFETGVSQPPEAAQRKVEANPAQQGFRGKLGVTTSSWLFNPERAFAVTHALNNSRPLEDWIGVEIYNSLPHPLLHRMIDLVPGFSQFNPPRITPDVVSRWQSEYPRTRVDQVHIEFNADRGEALSRVFQGITRKDGGDIRNLVWMYMFPEGLSQNGVSLANELGVGVNSHINVIEAYAANGVLDEVRKKVKFMQAENEKPYSSKFGRRLENVGIDSKMLMSDPKVIKEEVVDYYGLDGLLLGVDHVLLEGGDPTAALSVVSDVLSRVHLAGVSNGGNHTMVDSQDKVVGAFLQKASDMTFSQPVSVAFDGNPLEFRKMSFEDQVEKLDSLFKWIDQTQGRK